MAKDGPTGKKKKQGIVQRMMFGNDQKPDLTPEQMNMTAMETFSYLFFHRFGTMAAISLLASIFAIPLIVVMVLFQMNITINNGFIPFSSNLGIGYPVVVDAAQIGAETLLTYKTMECLVLVPCIAVFALGIAGNLYVIRKLIWEEPTSTVKDFFRGIKKCWLGAFVTGMVVGFAILLLMFTIYYFDTYAFSKGIKGLCIALAVILLVLISLVSAFVITQNAAFKMKPLVLIRNSILFVVGTNLLSVIFIGIAVAPTFLFLIPGATVIIGILYAMFGLSFTTLVISVYCHSCYKRYLYDKIDGKPVSAIYQKRLSAVEEQRAAEEKDEDNAQKKKGPVPYKNPKKRKKSIDEGASITPLAPTFRREDLERLEKEHRDVLRESADDELGEIDDDLPVQDGEVAPDSDETPDVHDSVSEHNDGMSDEEAAEKIDGDEDEAADDGEFAELTDAEKWL
ncbi:MAG: magnesium transporter [Clostridiales bacterium]|nr:magnesium transporter [Clostridiales bacterium]